MRCNRHVSDLSSSVGVCASCLRERLFVLIAAQVEENRRKTEDRHRKSTDAHHHHTAPLVFPRSVSPYICRRSDDSSWHQNDRRFYSTPQVGPTFNSSTRTTTKKQQHTRRSTKFSLLSSLFRSSKSEVSSSDHQPSDLRASSLPSSTASPISSSSSFSRSSWFSYLISGRRKKHSRFDDTPPVIPRTNFRTRDRGMSPTNADPDRNYDAAEDGSPSASGYSSESSQGWKKPGSATGPPIRRKGSTAQNRNVSGLAFCLSPLVRASPNSHRCQKDANLPPIGFSGEIVARKPTKSHLSTAASLCSNRSRKLADFGRYNYNP